MNYEATIKNKVKIKASFGITEYLAVSMQGYSKYKFKLFGKSKLEFDYAMNLYTQTDIDMQVLVCSTNKANEEYTDISKEIKDMLSSDEENDTGNLVKRCRIWWRMTAERLHCCRRLCCSTRFLLFRLYRSSV